MYVLDKFSYFVSIVKHNPSELIRLTRIGWNTFLYRYLKRCAGEGTIIGTGTQIINSANVHIGRRCWFQDSIYIRAGINGKVVLGDRVTLNSFCRLFGHGSIEIGGDTQIGPGTLITTTGHDYYQGLESSFSKIVIGKGVWIGANVTILPGIEIGNYAVIGAGSVVNKSIPPRSLAVGVPARVIRRIQQTRKAAGNDTNSA
jgi:acetyltransferase-like isoleucine patch superfamily enzyme